MIDRRPVGALRRELRLLRVPGVYGPCRDSELLAEAVRAHVRDGDEVLDVFTGSGVQAVEAARSGAADVWAIDVGRRAVAAAWINARLNGVRVTSRRGSIFEPVGKRRFDVITANPPYVPSVGDGPVTGPARAWEAGPDGRQLLDPLLRGLSGHLRPGGLALIVHSSLCDVDRTIAMLVAEGLEAEAIARETAALGPITAPRAEDLRRRGLLAPGVSTETTVVVRAVAPVREEHPAHPAAGLALSAN